jgi:uncharacterized protein with ParB-like and HNH nuclease domain
MLPPSGKEKSLSELLNNKKYTVPFYQREYRWKKQQINELISDITGEFMEFYNNEDPRSAVANYGCYYLGSIISTGGTENAIIDGQQRLTSLMLLLIYLGNIQKKNNTSTDPDINPLIYSSQFGKKSFNLDIDERHDCLDNLYAGHDDFDTSNSNESVKNMAARYKDIDEIFPEELKDSALPYFLDWLINKVIFIEINTRSDSNKEAEQDAQKIFVTMNDRGLSLTPTEMLKGYLLSQIKDNEDRQKANELWKSRIQEINNINLEEKNADDDFIKNWIRAQYANTIRETKKGAVNEDWDLIGTQFHKWLKDNADSIGLMKSDDFKEFVLDEFKLFSSIYIKLKNYSMCFNKEYEYVYYNANRNFTLQYQLILAAINKNDYTEIIDKKIKIISCFVDQYIMRRSVNFKATDYSTIKNAVFNYTLQFRRLSIDPIDSLRDKAIDILEKLADKNGELFTLDGINRWYLNNSSKRFIFHALARLTSFLEIQTDIPGASFVKYADRNTKNPYDIEHILADDFQQNKDNFDNADDFDKMRNRFGALLLLPLDKNRSFQDMPYTDKKDKYYNENILAATLNEKCYQNNPRFINFMDTFDLNFVPLDVFDKNSIESRTKLYLQLAKLIWNTDIIKSMST